MEIESNSLENFEYDDKLEVALPSHIQTCIESIVAKQDFITFKILTRSLSTNGGNYLGELYDITIKGQSKNGPKELNIFVKNAITPNEEINSFFSVDQAYANECFVYKELSKIFKKLENDARIPEKERYRMVQSYEESSTKAIVMENVTKRGYKTLNRFEDVPLEFLELGMKQLAKFHSLSFAMQRKMPEIYEKKIANFEYLMKFNENWRKFNYSMFNLSIRLMRKDYQKKAKEIDTESILNSFEKHYTVNDGLAVLCHSDYRLSNIVVKKEECKIKEIIPLDYQGIYYGNPANDIIYFIYGCTDRQFRDKHMGNLIDLYYETMKEYLLYFEIDVNDVMPRAELKKSLDKRIDLCYAYACVFFPFFFGAEDSHANISDSIDSYQVKLEPRFVKRIEEVLDELEELGGVTSRQNLWG